MGKLSCFCALAALGVFSLLYTLYPHKSLWCHLWVAPKVLCSIEKWDDDAVMEVQYVNGRHSSNKIVIQMTWCILIASWGMCSNFAYILTFVETWNYLLVETIFTASLIFFGKLLLKLITDMDVYIANGKVFRVAQQRNYQF